MSINFDVSIFYTNKCIFVAYHSWAAWASGTLLDYSPDQLSQGLE